MGIWFLLDAHGRDYRAMADSPTKIRIEATRAECDRTSDPEGAFQRVMLIEKELYQSWYKRGK